MYFLYRYTCGERGIQDTVGCFQGGAPWEAESAQMGDSGESAQLGRASVCVCALLCMAGMGEWRKNREVGEWRDRPKRCYPLGPARYRGRGISI